MPAIVIPHVTQVVLKWRRYQGVKPVNVLHFVTHGAGWGDPAELATNLGTVMTDAMFGPMSTSHAFFTIGVTPLDGVTAEREFTVPGRSGSGGANIDPAVAAVVSLRTSTRGPRGRGRVYIGPVADNEWSQGSLVAGLANTTTAAWDTFRTALPAQSGAFDLVVASKKHLTWNIPFSSVCEAVVATQRRRQTQLR